MRILCVPALSLIFAASAQAADLNVSVRDAAGRPVPDAVVTVRSARAAASQQIHFPWAMQMSQQDISFAPHVLIVPVGAEVTFPNRDRVRHHVYSFSAAKRFELKLYGREDTRRVVFDKAGVVPVGCNIHDQMLGYIYVVDTPYAAKTGDTGDAALRDLPDGAATLTVWSPLARKPVTIPVSGSRQTVTLDLRPGPAEHEH
jgi:plastocyanin